MVGAVDEELSWRGEPGRVGGNTEKIMKTKRFPEAGVVAVMVMVVNCQGMRAEEAKVEVPAERLVGMLMGVQRFLGGEESGAARVSMMLEVGEATGGLKELGGRRAEVVLQPPNRFVIKTEVDGPVMLSSDGTKLWVSVPGKGMVLEGDPAVPRFSGRPDSVGSERVPTLGLPVTAAQMGLLPVLAEIGGGETGGKRTMTVRLKPEAVETLKLPGGTVTLTMSGSGDWPETVRYDDGKGTAATVRVVSREAGGALGDDAWRPAVGEGVKVERVALGHLTRFLGTALGSLGSSVPSLPPVSGERRLIGVEGKGRLERHDGTQVLFLSGTPEEMGRQQGVLLKTEIRRVVDRILYGVGVGSSFGKGRWFFGEIEEAVRRTGPFVDARAIREMDALAGAAGLEVEEVRLANFFPELFHCSGFALMGKATAGGRMFHGRVLDYLRGVGLEENAVVMVIRPEVGHAWVNLGYAGFIGSVTAMNEKQVAIGEMGGRGEGKWDGKPMAQLMREVMERAGTIDEALAVMRGTARTCEYYYVLSDAKSGRACGVKATPEAVEVVWSGESHPQLSDPVADTVLMSAGDRYKALVAKVKDGYGTFDAAGAMGLMGKPVCMNSNIQSVLFAPDTLDFWVANADGGHVASECRFTKYNLRALLDGAPAEK